MAKDERDKFLEQGERLLAEWGAAPNAEPAALSTHAHRDGHADCAIAARLGGRADDAGVPLLKEIDARSTDKVVRKEVKRALYRLQQRGIAVPTDAEKPTPAPVLAPQFEGYLSAIDGRGDQLVWLIRPVSGGVAHLFAVINDPDGMRETALTQTTRKALREGRQELERRHEIRMVEADWHYCDFLMDRAFRWAQERGGRVEGDYPGLRGQILRTPAPADLPPLVGARLNLKAIRADADLLEQSVQLLEEKEFRTWFFDPDTLKPYLDALMQVKDSPLVLTQAQQQERFVATVERAVAELFGGDKQQSYARRLFMMAYYFSATHREDAAKRACAAALALTAATQGGRDIPLCDQLVRTSLAAFMQAAAQQEQEQTRTSLIMTPQQAAQAAEAARRRRR